MPKDVAQSVRDALSQAATSITEAMAAPDAMAYMPVLRQLHTNVIAIIQHGQLPPQQGQQGQLPGQPGPGAGGPPGGPPQAPGPAAGQPTPQGGLPSAPGQGLFPNSPIPSANELQAYLGNRTGP